jgi:hypothetical protein
MPSPTLDTSFLSLVSELVAESTKCGEPLPWYLSKPSASINLALALLSTVILGAAVATGWGLFVVPLGVVPINLWTSIGLVMTASLLRFKTPMAYTGALLMEETYKIDADPTRTAHKHAIDHIIHLSMPILLLVLWAILALVGCLV